MHGCELGWEEAKRYFHCVSEANAWASAHALSMVMWYNQKIVVDQCLVVYTLELWLYGNLKY